MKRRILKRLLKRYHNGTANQAERFIVDRWYDSFADHDQKIPGLEDDQSAGETAQRIFGKIKFQRITKPWYYRPGYQIAGCVALLSASLLVLYTRQEDNSASLHSIVYHTLKGQTKKIMLNDSTAVWLNANSTMEVLPEYAKETRQVKLTGEAYFEVKHDRKHPFIIATQGIKTQVLGTSFNISAYPILNQLEVTVRTGKVSVSNPQFLLATLLPGKSLHYNKTNHKVTVTDENPELMIAWRDGRTLVNDASFSELAEIFSNTLNVKLVSKDKKINSLQFRLSLDRKLSVDDNLKLIAGIHQLKYRRIESNVIELYK